MNPPTWLASLLSEKGTVSATRVVMCGWFFLMFTVWTAQSLKAGALAEIPASVLTFSGLMLGTKVAQKFAE